MSIWASFRSAFPAIVRRTLLAPVNLPSHDRVPPAGTLAPAICLQQAWGPRVPHAGLSRLRCAFLLRGALAGSTRSLAVRLTVATYRSALLAPMVALLLAVSVPAIAQTAANYVIGPQDVLTIQVFDQADLGGKYTVESDGTFSFPLIGRVKAAGMTLREFEGELKKKLADGYFKNPQVTVAVEQYRSQRVFVMGEVRQPGPVPLTGGMTLIEALARAGSTLPSASGEVSIVRAPAGTQGPVLPDAVKPDPNKGIEVFRVNIRELEAGSLDQNIELRDGDTIFVPRAELIYIFGQVKNPGSYGIQKDTTVLQALSLAGGVTPSGAMGRIKIIRMVDGEKKELKVKLSDLVKPGDTIVVPERYF